MKLYKPRAFITWDFAVSAVQVKIKGVSYVAMVTYCVTKVVTTCSPMIGQFFYTMIKSGYKSGYNDPSKFNSWKLLETVANHLKMAGNYLYTYACVERGTVRLKCRAQEHNPMTPGQGSYGRYLPYSDSAMISSQSNN